MSKHHRFFFVLISEWTFVIEREIIMCGKLYVLSEYSTRFTWNSTNQNGMHDNFEAIWKRAIGGSFYWKFGNLGDFVFLLQIFGSDLLKIFLAFNFFFCVFENGLHSICSCAPIQMHANDSNLKWFKTKTKEEKLKEEKQKKIMRTDDCIANKMNLSRFN